MTTDDPVGDTSGAGKWVVRDARGVDTPASDQRQAHYIARSLNGEPLAGCCPHHVVFIPAEEAS